MHYGTFPLLTGTPEALQGLLGEQQVSLLTLQPGENARISTNPSGLPPHLPLNGKVFDIKLSLL